LVGDRLNAVISFFVSIFTFPFFYAICRVSSNNNKLKVLCV